MWIFGRKNSSEYSGSSTAEEVTHGVNATGLTAIVTGASSGIGAETTRVLALRGIHVIMVDKNMVAGKEIRTRILEEIPCAKLDIMEMDLSSIASVRNFASDFKSLNLPLNILINNAGVLGIPFTLSQDNIEMHFATNYLAINRFLLYTNIFMKDIPQGAATSCYVALHPQVKGISGEYFNNCKIAKPSAQAQDATLSMNLVKQYGDHN